MKFILTIGAAAGAALLGAVTLSGAWLPTGSQEGIAVGTVADFHFSTPPVNARGIRNLDELRGKPVLIDFWGTR